MKIPRGFIPIAEAAKESGYSIVYLRRLAQQKKVPGEKHYGIWFVGLAGVFDYKFRTRRGRPVSAPKGE